MGTVRGKEEELVCLMKERNIDMLGLCETRLTGKGTKILHDNYQLIYSGGRDSHHGVGVILTEEMAKRVGEVEQSSERIMAFSVSVGDLSVSVIQVYAPQQGRPLEERERFYEELQNVKNRVPHGESVVILGDLNGHIGQDRRGIEHVIGAYGIGDKNLAGESVIDFCVQNHLSVMNTFYDHRESHKWTWYRWNSRVLQYTDKSMIDLILTNNKRIFRDVKAIPSVSCDSDHRIVVGKLRLDKPKVCKSKGTKRFLVEKLKDPECKEEFQRRVRESRENQNNTVESVGLEDCWRTFHSTVNQLAEEVMHFKINYGKKKKKTAWWTDEVQDVVKKKMKMFRKWIKTRRAEDREEYVEARRETERIKKREKEQVWIRIGRDLEADLLGTRKLIYNLAKNYRKGSAPPAYAVKGENGELLTVPEEISRRWTEYFENLLNVVNNTEGNYQQNEEESDGGNSEDSPITVEEVQAALKKMKNGKAAGEDLIPAEILKNLGDEGILWMTEIFNKCWNESKTPESWNKSIVCPIFKKGDKTNCKNYRGIALMPHIAKVYERILERRLREKVESKLDEWQHGFRPGRSTIDLVFALKMLYEKNWEFNNKVYLAFIDLEKAFDRVPRNILWNILGKEEYEIPIKLIKAIKSTYVNSLCRVKTQTDNNEWFRVTTGVKQGSVLSPILFILFMDYCAKLVMRKANGEIFGYADDLALISETEAELQRFLTVWDEELTTKGMKISREKTEVMILSKENENLNIRLGDQNLRQTDQFKYLGVMFGTENDMIVELNHRISKFNTTFNLLYPLLKDRHIPSSVKTVIYTSILRPILLYGYEAWTLTTKTRSKIQACEMKVLRLIRRVTRRDRLRNDDIREELGVESILKIIERGQLRWFGHVKRMEETRYPRKYYEWEPGGRRRKGRPRRRWRDNIKTYVEKRGSNLEDIDINRTYEDRNRWKTFIWQDY